MATNEITITVYLDTQEVEAITKRTASTLSILKKDGLVNDHDIELVLEKLIDKLKGMIKVVEIKRLWQLILFWLIQEEAQVS